MRLRCIFSLCVIVSLSLSGGQALRAAVPNDAPAAITIAYQPGLSYASFIVMRDQRILERQFPNTKVNWTVLASTAAVRDGFIANQIQIGAGSIPPFLTGWDRGVNWKVLASLNQMSVWLVTKDRTIHSLKDIKPDMKIGMPSPDSIQGLTLRKAALEQLGNAHALDNNIVSIDHPLGFQALEAGQLNAHLSSPPVQYQEVQAGGHVVLKSYDFFGRHTFNNVYVSTQFANDHPQFIRTFYRDLLDVTQSIKSHPRQAAQILSKDTGGKASASDFENWIRRSDIVFSTTPRGFLTIAKFMNSIGMISKVPSSMREINLPLTLGGAGD